MRFSELSHELTALLRGYPAFVTRRGTPTSSRARSRCSCFTRSSRAQFEEQIEFLVANGYRTLSLSEYLDTQAGRRAPGAREVLLTFDDARSSFWLFAFPILRKAGLKADAIRHHRLDARHERAAELGRRVGGARCRRVISRPSIPTIGVSVRGTSCAGCTPSGTVSVDSHSHLHRRVFASRRLLSLIRAEDDFSASNAVHGPYLSCRESPLELDPDNFVGLPLFGVRGFLEDGPAVRLPMAAAREFQALARESPRPHQRSAWAVRARRPAQALAGECPRAGKRRANASRDARRPCTRARVPAGEAGRPGRGQNVVRSVHAGRRVRDSRCP